jgi:hypothetical protein
MEKNHETNLKDLKTVLKAACKALTMVYLVVLFRIVKTGKQPKYPSVIDKFNMVCADNGLLFSAKRKRARTKQATKRHVGYLNVYFILNERR